MLICPGCGKMVTPAPVVYRASDLPPVKNEWTDALILWAQSHLSVSDLLAIATEATRELCADFPQHGCHSGATTNWKVAEKVTAHIRANYL